MQPEDIDKLFRDKLQHHAPTPPAFLWDQLEEEIRPARKRPALWLYAAAAMIALLIVAGGGWLLRTPGSDSGLASGTLATTTRPASSAKPAAAGPEKKSAASQATAATELPSSGVEGQQGQAATEVATTNASVPAAKPEAVHRPSGATPTTERTALLAQTSSYSTKAIRPASVPARPEATTSSAAATQPERRPDEAVAVVEPTPNPAPTGPIEVEVHRGTEAPVVALAAPADAPQPYASDSHLKNLFHKAKTAVKDGRVKLPKVELPESVTVQVNVFNHSTTKVIQL
ncbi:hypothetical protein [Hymenobacter cellulosivorans]|uniref:Uncharacterized protein n=1 Tax=Hymenobacter cellulosivorans TaxID=2932249 RepID=A0ABY4F568_9BACT|nr:hypothetical protein [Hymenobacter cellulosivorans]UOQ51786.1 hypothetical protein MUN80_18735 [Hymenobacter cellulosivorans]